jgi:hypothetical protein
MEACREACGVHESPRGESLAALRGVEWVSVFELEQSSSKHKRETIGEACIGEACIGEACMLQDMCGFFDSSLPHCDVCERGVC